MRPTQIQYIKASYHYSQPVHVETLQPQGRNLRVCFGLDPSLYSLLTVRGLHPVLVSCAALRLN